MVVLKKIKGSTLMETMVATILIVTIFMISSMLLNNVLSTQIKNNTKGVSMLMEEIEYKYLNNLIATPYYVEESNWEIGLDKQQYNGNIFIVIEANNTVTGKLITNYIDVQN